MGGEVIHIYIPINHAHLGFGIDVVELIFSYFLLYTTSWTDLKESIRILARFVSL